MKRVGAVILLLMLLPLCHVLIPVKTGILAVTAHAQTFGKNKVNYSQHEWQTIRSNRVEIYFPKGSDWLARFTAREAEQALDQLEEAWGFEVEDTIPLIIYNSHNSFSETNVIGGRITEGVGGFTEFNRSRVVIPYEGSYERMRHVIHHELVHAVQFKMFRSGSLKSLALNRLMSLPLWVTEGVAEFESMGWDIGADNVLRDAVISDYLPPIEQMLYGVFAYKGGQALYRYLALTYGRDNIARFLKSLKSGGNVERGLQEAFGVSMAQLEREWRLWLKKEYWPEIAERLSPVEFARQMTEHLKDGGYLNVGARLSPDGTRLAYISSKRGFADVYLMDVETRRSERIIEGEQSPEFESLFLLRPGLAWSPDGAYLAVVAKMRGHNALFIYDVVEGEVEREFVFDLDAMFTPAWNPNGNVIAVVGLKDGWSDLYNVELPDGDLTRLTNDPYDERDPDWSPDGRLLAFSSDRPDESLEYEDSAPFRFGQYDIYALDAKARRLIRLTDHPSNDMYPAWSPDGAEALFVSERSGVGNMYLKRLEGGEARPVTDALTGAQQLDWSTDGSQVCFTAFQEGGYDIFLMEDPRSFEGKAQPEKTELAKRLFDAAAASAALDASQEEKESGETVDLPIETAETEAAAPPNLPPSISTLPSLSDLETSETASLCGDSEASSEETGIDTPLPVNKSDEEGVVIPLIEGGGDENEESEKETKRERKYTRPRAYRPRMSVESFGIATQINSFVGFSGQAYLTMSDLLGNQRLLVVTDQSISSIKNLNALVQYAHLHERWNYGIAGFHTRDYFLANEPQRRDRVALVADRNIGFRALLEWPFSPYSRLEGSFGYQAIQRDHVGIRFYDYYRVGPFGEVGRQEVEETPLDRKSMLPMELAYVADTVGYGMYGPADGKRMRLSFFTSPAAGERFLQFATFKGDWRHYFPIGETQSVAARLSGGTSFGRNAQAFFLGGVRSEISPRVSSAVDEKLRADSIFFPSFEGPLRGSNLYEYTGDSFLLVNLEWRFELIEQLALGFPLPIAFRRIGGNLFIDIGSAFDASGPDRLNSVDDLAAGIGFGARFNLGVFILRFDAAWRAAAWEIAKEPRYYWSIGADF